MLDFLAGFQQAKLVAFRAVPKMVLIEFDVPLALVESALNS